ncbi:MULTISPECIES: sugar ABC transporter substrate-binding protein [Paenibacillus]|uniref:sugar ABC transporter substrate-binding protein n=1 Tax=Paenibacillus TaxID=44249 RepID=UPI0022B85CF4|nr:sugar ABC transporter substrate-binding protein [Paenibacillus caseinilyticus]MCZ8521372.1 sugar ABC transporter substrate-binding protein [Paenibacillus caseinilyticus]
MKKTPTYVLAAMLTASMMFTGCSSSTPASDAGPAASEPGGKDKPVTLNAWIMPNSPKPDQDFLTTLKPYLDQNKHVTLKVTVLDWGSAWTKITTAATSGEGPDLLQLGTSWVPAIASMNGIEEISGKVKEIGGEEAYLPASWKTTKIEGTDKVYGVPWFVDARAIFYRTDAFKKAGVDPATAFDTWDSFREALKKVNGVQIGDQKMSALGIPGKNDWNVPHNLFPWIWSAGGSVLTKDNKAAAFNDELSMDGILYYTGLVQDGLVDKTSLEKNSAQVESDFADGRSAALIAGPWMVKNFTTPTDAGGMAEKLAASNYGVAPLPAGPKERATFIGGSNLTVFKGSKNKDAAWDVIRFLSTDEAQLSYAKLTGFLPAKTKVIQSEELTKDPGFAAFAEAAKYGKSYPSIPQWGPMETALVKYFGNIWDIVAGVKGTYSKEAVKQQLDDAAREVNGILNQ